MPPRPSKQRPYYHSGRRSRRKCYKAMREVSAILAQIEGEMTPDQLAAIAAMQLTQDDLLV